MARTGLAEMFAVISFAFTSGIFVVSSVSYFAGGGEPLAWMDAVAAVVLMTASVFNARRILQRIS
jgi:hypothetical protein